MEKLLSTGLIMLLLITESLAQVAITNDGSYPDSSAMLHIKSTDKGLLLPRMEQWQIEEIKSPADGLLVYNTDDGKFYVFRSATGNWTEIELGTNTISPSSWVCGNPFTDIRDGKSYNTVQIGTQCWMAENINIGTRINGIINQTDNGIIEKHCYGDDENNCTAYGGLYMWDEMRQYVSVEGTRGICMPGWHLPTDVEWQILSDELGGDATSGDQLKSTTGWYGGSNGSNTSGFNGLPAGNRNTDGSFANLTRYASFFSSVQNSSTTAWNRYLSYSDDAFHLNSSWKEYGMSVRCIKN